MFQILLQTATTRSVVKVSIDDESVTTLWRLGFPHICPNVKKLKMLCSKHVTSDGIKKSCSLHWLIKYLHIEGSRLGSYTLIDDSASFCDAVFSSCPQLVKLSLSNLYMDNNKARDILNRMVAHERLKSIGYV